MPSIAHLGDTKRRRLALFSPLVRRAIQSALLNMAEGSYNRGKNRSARYHTSLGSLREALACFEVAAAMGYLPGVQPALRARFDHVLGTLVRLVGGH
jgi:four helix bundle protein